MTTAAELPADASTRQVGRLRVEVHEPVREALEGDAYRAMSPGALVIDRVAEVGPGRQRRAPVVVVISVINTLLLGFAAYVRSWPAVGAVSVAIVALVWLVAFLGRDRGAERSIRVEMGDDRLRGPGLDLPVTALRQVGVGLGPGGSKTVWVSALGDRRVVFDELSEAEADAAASALREGVARRVGTRPSVAARRDEEAPPSSEVEAENAPSNRAFAVVRLGLGVVATLGAIIMLVTSGGRGTAPGLVLLGVGMFVSLRAALKLVATSDPSAQRPRR